MANHEVYLSFEKDDPSKFITDFVAKSLSMKGIPTFKDERQLRNSSKGINIARELRDAIGMSKICVVLFTESYLSSNWCLEELVAILKCRQQWGLIVLPIFYEVEPSDIRHQRGVASKALEVQKKGGLWYKRWKSALKEAANFCGWNFNAMYTKSVSLLVGNVVTSIEDKEIPTNLRISICPLRYDTFDQYLNLFTQVGIDDVLVVGICGPSGMGKTLIAEIAYKQVLYAFEGCCFLANVGQESRKPDGLRLMQEKLLADTLNEPNIDVMNTTIGMTMIKEKLHLRRVLIVLDDVDDLEQLYALVGDRSWFGLGSKIIITTRRLYLLSKLGVDQIFLAKGLPLPPNIKIIWGKFHESRRRVAGLKEYFQLLHQMTMEKERCLMKRLLQQRQQNEAQAQVIADLKQARRRFSGLIELQEESKPTGPASKSMITKETSDLDA